MKSKNMLSIILYVLLTCATLLKFTKPYISNLILENKLQGTYILYTHVMEKGAKEDPENNEIGYSNFRYRCNGIFENGKEIRKR